MSASGPWLLGLLLLAFALGVALGVLVLTRSNSRPEVETPASRTVQVEPIELQPTLAVVELGGVPGGQVMARRKLPNGQLLPAEQLHSAAYFTPGQFVRVDNGVAYPTPYPEGG